jgi:hypothetical protein
MWVAGSGRYKKRFLVQAVADVAANALICVEADTEYVCMHAVCLVCDAPMRTENDRQTSATAVAPQPSESVQTPVL